MSASGTSLITGPKALPTWSRGKHDSGAGVGQIVECRGLSVPSFARSRSSGYAGLNLSPHGLQRLNMDFEIITPSRGLDFERCQLLCQTIDRFVGGSFRHIVVVDRSDYQLFKPLRNSVRDVIEIESLLPSWIRPTNFVFGRFRRRIWIGWRCRPIHGWFAQQLAKISVVHSMESNIAVFADSDVFFVRPFDLSHITRELQSSPRARARSHRRGQNSPSRLVRNGRTSS